jgi:uncharacterized protein
MAANADLETQVRTLHSMLMRNEHIRLVLERAHRIQLPNWYLGAGCVAQTVWNLLSGRPPAQGIKDVDLVYFDAKDLSEGSEHMRGDEVRAVLHPLPLELDVKNQARVHLWYEAHFGYSIRPYVSVEDAINTWPTTATAVGVRPATAGLAVYAPFGLNDLFSRIIRPNKAQITETLYSRKVARWTAEWPDLRVIPWS